MSRALKTLALFPGEVSPPPSEPRLHGPGENRLWIAAHFPKLALESLAAAPVDEAAVVTESWRGCARVIAANDKALSLGIRPNIKLSAAFALSDSLHVLMRCSESEQSKLRALGEYAQRFTPVVSLVPPAALLMEVSGSIKLFGGLGAIKHLLAAGLREQRITAHLCAAPTALAALWLARHEEDGVLSREALVGRLSRVPLEAAEWPEKTQKLLKNMGIRTLGDCMRLPRDGFARRIGLQYLHELDKSRGSYDLRHELEPVIELRARIEFADEVSSTALLVNVGKKLIADLVEDLQKRQIQIQGFDCVLHHRDRTMTVEHINLVEPTQDEERFVRLFTDRLEQMRLPAPVVALDMRAGPAEPVIASHGSLFGHADGLDPGSAQSSLIERLQARFGMENLYGMDLVDEYRPEATWSKSRQFLRQRRPPLAISRARERPLWILPAPRRLSSTPDNRPCYKSHEPLRIEQGPERIESGWWDGREIGRDYYKASSSHDERLWIFQDHCASRDWYLHGFFG